MRFCNVQRLQGLLGLSGGIVRAILARNEYERDVKQYKSPILCNKKNKKLLVNALEVMMESRPYGGIRYYMFKDALSKAQELDWN